MEDTNGKIITVPITDISSIFQEGKFTSEELEEFIVSNPESLKSPLLVDEDGVVIFGEHLYEIAKMQNKEKIDVIVNAYLDDVHKEMFRQNDYL